MIMRMLITYVVMRDCLVMNRQEMSLVMNQGMMSHLIYLIIHGAKIPRDTRAIIFGKSGSGKTTLLTLRTTLEANLGTKLGCKFARELGRQFWVATS